MTLRQRRLWSLLLGKRPPTATTPAHANEASVVLALCALVTTVHGDATSEQQVLDSDGNLGHLSSLDSAGASDAVARAQSLLHKIRTPSHRSPRHRRPTGVFAKSWFYATKIFTFLFMNGPPTDTSAIPSGAWEKSQPWYEPMQLLEAAKAANNTDALYLLADISFYGLHGHPRNYKRAFDNYLSLAALNGNATAQHMVGFMYATGIGGVVEKDQAKALIYHTFAADGGDIQSEMTVGYRHHAGIATPRNCDKATEYYKKVADKAMEHLRSGPPGGRQILKEAYRLADEEGGPYGEGASVSSAGQNAKQGGPTTDAHAAFDDVLEYLDLMSRKGELKATFGLGRLHYEGSRALKQDYGAAKDFFLEIARKYWTKDGRVRSEPEPGLDKLASKAAGYLGRMFLRGEGMEQNFAKAKVWFKRGIENGDALCQYSLGLLYLDGLGVEKDAVRAADLFGAAADQDFSSAQVRLGALFLDQGDLKTATDYFSIALRNGHIEAFYYLAEINNRAIGTKDRSCTTAALYYKIVAEKTESIHSNFTEANDAYADGDVDTALTLYMMAAEQGYEIGQANVAFLLDAPRKPLAVLSSVLPWAQKRVSRLGDAALALIYWTRSAKQANIDSLVKMGDYYLSGVGAPLDAEKAAACYTAAAETLQSAQAMWNLGWMHENGIGIEQDFHLAKRYYDQALGTNGEAYLPVTLALLRLRARSAWNTLTRGKVNSIHDDAASRRKYSLGEWIANFLEADLEQYAADMGDDVGVGLQDEWDTAADAGANGPLYDDIDDGMVEMLAFVGLAGALAFLVYWRQQLGGRAREEADRNHAAVVARGMQMPGQDVFANAEEEQQRRERLAEEERQRGRGVFPAPGDPAGMEWAAGGVGH